MPETKNDPRTPGEHGAAAQAKENADCHSPGRRATCRAVAGRKSERSQFCFL